MKSHELFVHWSLPSFLFPSIKGSSFTCFAGTCTWLTMISAPWLQFSADLKWAHLCQRNIWQSVCFRSILLFIKKSIQLFGCLGSLLGHMRSLLLHAGPFFVTLRLNCPLEGNGNPLQCSCLENPMDGGAWWAATYGVAQSWTRLTGLDSSSSSTLKTCYLF